MSSIKIKQSDFVEVLGTSTQRDFEEQRDTLLVYVNQLLEKTMTDIKEGKFSNKSVDIDISEFTNEEAVAAVISELESAGYNVTQQHDFHNIEIKLN